MARTTPRTRAEIHDSPASVAELAQTYNISLGTARKWRNRGDQLDRSHRAHQMNTTLNAAQELIVMEIRRLCLLPLDDLVSVTKEFINAAASRSGISRLLRREGLSKLADLMPKAEGEETSKKSFKDYEPGFVHIDIKYLPQMPDEDKRSYLFVAIDRATRWVFMRIYADQTESSAVDFVRRVQQAASFKITKLLTDNGTQFTDRFTSKDKQATGNHAFDKQCRKLNIEHRLSPPRHPQTNGMVERFNGRISEVIKQTRFCSAAELTSTLSNYLLTYNHHIPQRALEHVSPVDALKNWREKKPELFVKKVYNGRSLTRLGAALDY
jgi:transposase InsO family protein